MPESTTCVVNELLRRRAAGDADARDELITVVQRRLLAFVRKRLGPALRAHVESEDVAQEASLRLRQALASEKVQPENAGRFFRLAVRHIQFELCELAEHYRRRAPSQPPESVKDISAAAADPARIHGNADWVVHITRIIESLPDDEREVIRLSYFMELTRDEIAETLGTSHSTVGRLLVRAKRMLAERLSPKSMAAVN